MFSPAEISLYMVNLAAVFCTLVVTWVGFMLFCVIREEL